MAMVSELIVKDLVVSFVKMFTLFIVFCIPNLPHLDRPPPTDCNFPHSKI